MPNLTSDITASQIFTAMGNFLKLLFPDVEVIQGQDNLVPMPKSQFISMTQGKMIRLATNQNTYTDLGVPGEAQGFKNIATPTEICIDINIYGKQSLDFVCALENVFRDNYAYNNFPDNIKPLYITDPIQLPLIDGEQQYNDRWKTTAHLMYTPTVRVSQQFAEELAINLFEEADIATTT
jgi:hypothetical protein